MQYKKLSVIIIDNDNIKECQDSIKSQSYIDNIETIVIHDLNELYSKVDIINGDFISIIDGKDTLSTDYYRAMVKKAIEENADIVMSNAILKYDDGGKAFLNLMESSLKKVEGKECIKEYLNQEGLSFLWSIFSNKIFTKELLKKTLDEIKNKEVEIEDFYFFTIMFYFANRIRYIKNDYLFYSITEISDKGTKINNIVKNFELMEDFLKEKEIYENNKEKVNRWKKVYSNYLGQVIIQGYDDIQTDTLYKIKTAWNNKLEEIKKEIMNQKTKVVSFDIFDTLILRPFWTPIDLFIFLDDYFRKVSNIEVGIDFSKLRIKAEEIRRKEILKENSKIQDITLDEIYEEIEEETGINSSILKLMMEKEKELELNFCSERKTAKELYELALFLGKEVICISDMYLPKETIQEILRKNGYNEISKLYVSSDIKLTKFTGDLYSYVIEDLKIEPKEIIHIGDNYFSDYENSEKSGITGKFLPKTIDIFCDENITNNLSGIFRKELPDWQNNINGLNFLGIRCMLALVANNYFDNPFRTFNNKTDFNADPNLIGYYALGMYLFGVSKWLLDDTINKNYDKIVFMARDGYWTMKAYQIISKLYKNAPKTEYLYISRRALIPVTLIDKLDFYKLIELIDIYKYSPKTILKYFKGILYNTENLEKECANRNIDANKKFESQNEFYEFVNLLLDKFYNKEEHIRQGVALKKYFSEIFSEKTCAFDIGYSAKPEMYLSILCNKPIDTYFINISNEEAFKHAKIGNFNLNVYFNYRPTITGVIRESLMSISDPSCIGYKVQENDEIEPIFDEKSKVYQERFVFDAMQMNAMKFIEDLTNIFKENLDLLYYQKYYISLPHEMYIHSPSKLDQEILSGINFEDSVGLGEKVPATDEWNREMKNKNQQRSQELFDIEENRKERIELKNKIIELEDKLSKEKENYKMLEKQKDEYKSELYNVYNSKRWKYTEKISKLIKRK